MLFENNNFIKIDYLITNYTHIYNYLNEYQKVYQIYSYL